MTIKYMLPAVSVLALMLAGCSSTAENASLVQARQDFSLLQAKPDSARLAPLETKDAFKALGKAEMASIKDRKAADVTQLSYLANQKIGVAEQTIALRQAEAGLQGIEALRTQTQLDVRTAQLKALQALKGKQSERGTVVTFGDVLFDTGRAELKPGSLRNLQQLAEYLRANPERQVRVEGFTDSVGSDASNLALSERRAASVAMALQRQGVAAQRIATAGYGKDYPVAYNTDAHSRQMNRRVEVIIANDSNAVRQR